MTGHVLEDVRAIQRVRRPHLLLALLRDPANGLADLLAEKGVTVDWLRERLAAECEGRRRAQLSRLSSNTMRS